MLSAATAKEISLNNGGNLASAQIQSMFKQIKTQAESGSFSCNFDLLPLSLSLSFDINKSVVDELCSILSSCGYAYSIKNGFSIDDSHLGMTPFHCIKIRWNNG